jgi:DNA-binding response OmpR family regulator
MRVLVVDDNLDIRRFLKEALSAAGFTVDTAGDGAEGSYMARINEYDVIILDYIMPRKNGTEVLRDIRDSGKATPILMLSVQDEIDDKVKHLNMGADDYMTKPFSFKELLSRVRALIRRPSGIIPTVLKSGDIVLDTINQKALRGSKSIYLTRKEYALTEYLMRNQGSIVSRGMLLEHVWNDGVDPNSNTVETHIRNLRKKLGCQPKKKIIHTIPGRGYKIEAHRVVVHDK